jgi:hypothetical protein
MAENRQLHPPLGPPPAGFDARADESRPAAPRRASRAGHSQRSLLAGGTDGNELLTVQTGAVLLVLLAVLGVTIIRIGQLTWLHMFLGLLLIGPVALKIGSTGYRFVRYYSHDPSYRRKGPPPLALRALGPLVVLTTIGVIGTGVVLLALGPASRGTWLLIHKVIFFVWLAATSLHVLGHLPELRHWLPGARRERDEIMAAASAPSASSLPSDSSPASGASLPSGSSLASRASLSSRNLAVRVAGGPARGGVLAVALLAGVALALALVPEFAPWLHYHKHHG